MQPSVLQIPGNHKILGFTCLRSISVSTIKDGIRFNPEGHAKRFWRWIQLPSKIKLIFQGTCVVDSANRLGTRWSLFSCWLRASREHPLAFSDSKMAFELYRVSISQQR